MFFYNNNRYEKTYLIEIQYRKNNTENMVKKIIIERSTNFFYILNRQ